MVSSLLLVAAIYQAQVRRQALQVQMGIVKQRMEKRQRNVIANLMLLTGAAEQERPPRRMVPRCLGKWRGSTISGYLRGGPSGPDEQTYMQNFRMSIGAFDRLVKLMEMSPLGAHLPTESVAVLRQKAHTRRGKRPACTDLARLGLDHPSTRFKVAACLYTMGQGGSIKSNADACGVGKSTLQKWLTQFTASSFSHLKPLAMPSSPWGENELKAVQGNFASRRGMPNVTMACDGSHIPFRPNCKKQHAKEYRNYKGWTSILAVAFTDSYYRFFDLHVGYPGKAGDNTVLKHYWLMKEIKADPDKWLGKNGVVLGDSGASDADGFFLNPYHSPTSPERCWFNFCHSSTRFFVEQTFGRWKNKWRFLMNPLNVQHKLATQLIFTSAILHNYCIMCSQDDGQAHVVERVGSSVCWDQFLKRCAAHLCPSCKRRGLQHCIHQATYRIGNAQCALARRAPSIIRDELCKKLWEQHTQGNDPMAANLVLGDEDAEIAIACGVGEASYIRKIMSERAHARGDVRFNVQV